MNFVGGGRGEGYGCGFKWSEVILEVFKNSFWSNWLPYFVTIRIFGKWKLKTIQRYEVSPATGKMSSIGMQLS
jgi:hypothetical protein